MDVSSFMSGNFMTHLDLPLPSQVWTINQVEQLLVGTDQKICVTFTEFPSKPLGLNKVNLRALVAAYSTDSNTWIGRQLELFKAQCDFQGRQVDCVRVRIPQQPAVLAAAPAPAAQVAQQPVAAPAVPVQAPVAPPQTQPTQVAPWEADRQK